MTDKTLPLRDVNTQAAYILKSWIAHEEDMRFAARAARWCAINAEIPDLITEVSVMFGGALIKYRRCFATGARARMTESDIASPRDPGGGYHRHIYNLASKYVAHDVYGLEQIYWGPLVDEENPNPVVGYGHFCAKLASFPKDSFYQMSDYFTYILVSAIKPRICELREAAEREVKNMNLQELLALPLCEFKAGQSSEKKVYNRR